MSPWSTHVHLFAASKRVKNVKDWDMSFAVSSPGCNYNQIQRVMYKMPGQAKSSMEFLVRLYALKLSKDRVNVNCIIPGHVRTDQWENALRRMSKRLPRDVGLNLQKSVNQLLFYVLLVEISVLIIKLSHKL